jgi:hypothetical protein
MCYLPQNLANKALPLYTNHSLQKKHCKPSAEPGAYTRFGIRSGVKMIAGNGPIRGVSQLSNIDRDY